MSQTRYERAVERFERDMNAAEGLIEAQLPARSEKARQVKQMLAHLLEQIDQAGGEIQELADEYAEDAMDVRRENDRCTGIIADLREALERANEDRAALRARLGLTDFAWSSQGGACDAELQVVVPEFDS